VQVGITFIALPIMLLWLITAIVLLSIRRTRWAGGLTLVAPVFLFVAVFTFRVSSVTAPSPPRAIRTAEIVPPPTPLIDLEASDAPAKVDSAAGAKPPAPSATKPAPAKAPAKAPAAQGVDVNGNAAASSVKSDVVPTAAKRPPWVDADDAEIGSNFEMTVRTAPFKTLPECETDLQRHLPEKALQYMARQWPTRRIPQSLPLNPVLMQKKGFVAERYIEPVQTSFGPMQVVHARLTVNADLRQYLEQVWRQTVLAERMQLALALLASVLGVLAVAWVGIRGTAAIRWPRIGWGKAIVLILVALAAVAAVVGFAS